MLQSITFFLAALQLHEDRQYAFIADKMRTKHISVFIQRTTMQIGELHALGLLRVSYQKFTCPPQLLPLQLPSAKSEYGRQQQQQKSWMHDAYTLALQSDLVVGMGLCRSA